MTTECKVIERVAKAVCGAWISPCDVRCKEVASQGGWVPAKGCTHALNVHRARSNEILAALRPGDSLPGGLVVVRKEPTETMLNAGAWRGKSLKEIYKAMLAAQPGQGDSQP